MKINNILFASARIVKVLESGNKGKKLKNQALRLTPSAIARVKELIAKEPDNVALRIGVQQRGCNGLSYTLNYANVKGRFDEEVEQDGVKVWIDAKAQLSIIGSEMDYVESKLASEFIFRSPNIKSTCGCGESFNL